jgi:hypothetical protein
MNYITQFWASMKSFNEPEHYVEEEVATVVENTLGSVQLSIVMMMEDMIAKAEELSRLPYPVTETVEKSKEVATLIQAGFTSHPLVVEYNEKVSAATKKFEDSIEYRNGLRKIVEALQLLIKARRCYGNDTLLLPFDKFQELCHKYDLACGALQNYRGDVPSDKLQEIIELQSKGRLREVIELMPVKEVTNISRNDDWKFRKANEYLRDLPFIVKNEETMFEGQNRIEFANGEFLYYYRGEDFIIETHPSTDFFIAAPCECFKEHYKINEVPKDPFICSLTSLGVLIFTRWGEEANDDIIKRFEEFNHKLDTVKLDGLF